MNRRDFIKKLGLAGTSAAAYAACSSYMREALAQSTTTINDLLTTDMHCKGSLEDIEHVVLLMQENRSFDHYFGTLRGVRGFGDPRPLRMRDGEPVWHQAQVDPKAQRVRPYRLPSTGPKPVDDASDPGTSGNVFLQDPAHDHSTGLAAWNNGLNDKWISQKQIVAMAHYTEADIPLYFKLAKAFTLCDAHFCSLNGPTDPNRSYFWTGTSKANNENFSFSTLALFGSFGSDWKTYPEKLEDIGVSWKFYQDGLGWPSDPFDGNYGDNTIAYFKQFQNKTTVKYAKAQSVNSILRKTANVPSQFEQDIIDDKLPAVSWIVAPEAFSEHPKYPPHFGEYYVHEILRAFAANKKVWQKTLFLITYDENGGFFDHVLPPVAPMKTTDGLVSPGIKLTPATAPTDINSESTQATTGWFASAGEPLGMGTRVPTLVISPWSIGGRVCSEVFDHTSFIRFLDTWLIARELQAKDAPVFSNISSWRQAIAGDLTSALDFDRQKPTSELAAVIDPTQPAVILTDTQRANVRATGAFSPNMNTVNADPDKDKPVAAKQDTTRCDILPIGYDMQAFVRFTSDASKKLQYTFRNRGMLGSSFYVIPYDKDDAPLRYSIEGAKAGGAPVELSDKVPITQRPGGTPGDYSYVVYGPNGYLFEFKGNALAGTEGFMPDIADVKSLSEGGSVEFGLDWPAVNGKVKVIDAYTGRTKTVDAGTRTVEVVTADGWYDVAFVDANNTSRYLRRYAGHLENGRIGKSDPAIGRLYNAVTRVYEGIPVMTATATPVAGGGGAAAATPLASPVAGPAVATPPSDGAILLNL
ncbi:phosphocholine-specific phospholipase C [Rhizobium tubonense]|uniref:phospholipase C n=1 Tax=Rhizobium tubonense TaxID=484088 RepID=A0A2W4CKC6_9HYPH|nr:phospholipase C, phosphocholine-specific [Rhizobium tubonense]PZM13091.1 phospholipase C, phosphocholine-specific [Rhizobium tubonense]